MPLLVAALLAFGQGAPPDLDKQILRARTVAIAPKSKPPAWLDDAKIQAGYAFFDHHRETIVQVLGTSSLVATFAAKDVAPVLVQTGRLTKDFDARMHETEASVGEILDPPKTPDDFVRREYADAVALGGIHASVAESVRKPLGWNPRVRVPMNGQSYAFVLYTFAWWPVETLVAMKKVDPVRDAREIDGWLHLWSVVGYGMGVPEGLLPRDSARAGAIVPLLRGAQYAAKGEPLPDGLPTLLGGEVRLVASILYDQAKAKGKPPASPESLRPLAALGIASMVAFSPGLADALGLGPKPVPRLLEYAALLAPK